MPATFPIEILTRFITQPRHLPTARIVPVSGPLVPPNTLEQAITPLLFETSRLLSIVPAVFGVLYNLIKAWHAPMNGKNVPIDYIVSALWVRHFDFDSLNTPNKRNFYPSYTKGRAHGISVSLPHHRPVSAMEGVLSPIINLDSSTRAAGHLLARDALQPNADWPRRASRDLLGCHR